VKHATTLLLRSHRALASDHARSVVLAAAEDGAKLALAVAEAWRGLSPPVQKGEQPYSFRRLFDGDMDRRSAEEEPAERDAGKTGFLQDGGQFLGRIELPDG
jgi:hypothetical protein